MADVTERAELITLMTLWRRLNVACHGVGRHRAVPSRMPQSARLGHAAACAWMRWCGPLLPRIPPTVSSVASSGCLPCPPTNDSSTALQYYCASNDVAFCYNLQITHSFRFFLLSNGKSKQFFTCSVIYLQYSKTRCRRLANSTKHMHHLWFCPFTLYCEYMTSSTKPEAH